ncbi:MAG: bifunctional diaminohydroxyphosphoribosylaminopyrimidine deaminase/5-amino-6-(5-phosphoribosylamino)uracil reductase RibD [Pirellulaceae bacterium]
MSDVVSGTTANRLLVPDQQHMLRALELAARGEGWVEPNPMVGCVIVRDGVCLGEGWHRRYGGPHAEIEAIAACETEVAGATVYVTLEPCCHTGKTPPCTEALVRAQIARVVVAQMDPFPAVAGQGIRRLREAGITVEVGLEERAARDLNAPYLKLIGQGRPWVIAKWAMTLDGKIASRTGHSRWISNERSRGIVQRLRGRVDGILVGRRTAAVDDPLLLARPAGPRLASRIVLDSDATLSIGSRLVQSASTVPLVVVVGESADASRRRILEEAGCEVLTCPGVDSTDRLCYLLQELGRRRVTNLLVEGGGQVLGGLFDLQQVDEVHVFVAPKIIGGQAAPSPVAGLGGERMPELPTLTDPHIEVLDQDVYIRGRLS